MNERIPGWEAALTGVLERWRRVPYDRTTANCLLMIREAAIAITGRDPLRAIGLELDQVTTALGLARCVARCGGIVGVVDACLGPRLPIALSERGDALMLLETTEDGDPIFGVHDGQHGIFRSPAGTTARALGDVSLAWRI